MIDIELIEGNKKGVEEGSERGMEEGMKEGGKDEEWERDKEEDREGRELLIRRAIFGAACISILFETRDGNFKSFMIL